ncbi:MAG TPA: hypothetical protein VMU02_07750 [bacterium]|nr:hypothetical protein [bacterium]
MKSGLGWLVAIAGCLLVLLPAACAREGAKSAVTVPIVLDHNRMTVEAEFQRKDGSWRKARLWVDTGNPDFFISEGLARDLGIDLSAAKPGADGQIPALEITPPAGVRIGGMPIDLTGIKSQVMSAVPWLFSTTGSDANLPATVLEKYQVVFDYPRLELTLAPPGSLPHRGTRVPASVNPETGIIQIDGSIGGDSLSLALDNGASYSYVSLGFLDRLSGRHPDWPRTTGAVGCANIWGWWPEESAWAVVRVPEMQLGAVHLAGVGLVGLPNFLPGGMDVGTWYSQKTARPVAGFLGPNAFKAFRLEFDYAGSAVYFEQGAEFDTTDMDLVGLTLRPEADGSYSVVGVAARGGQPAVQGVEAGDKLLQVGGLRAQGATMGKVVDALRGKPGETRTLLIERAGKQLEVDAKVERFL